LFWLLKTTSITSYTYYTRIHTRWSKERISGRQTKKVNFNNYWTRQDKQKYTTLLIK